MIKTKRLRRIRRRAAARSYAVHCRDVACCKPPKTAAAKLKREQKKLRRANRIRAEVRATELKLLIP